MRFDTRPACYAVIVRGGEVLLSHYSAPQASGWTLPGGGMEVGESPEECVMREVFEETGYRVLVQGLADARADWFTPEQRWSAGEKDLLALKLVYRAGVIDGELVCEVDGSTDDARWVPLAELAEYADPHGWPQHAIEDALRSVPS